MADVPTQARLTQLLAREAGRDSASLIVQRIEDSRVRLAAVTTLLEELESASPKAFRSAVDALSELERRGALSSLESWLDLGVALAESSGASALKYFRDSPLILGVIESPAARSAVLSAGLELADRDPNVALEYLRTAPQMLSVVPFDDLGGWMDVALELVQVDVVVGLEYIRQIPMVAPVLPLSEVRSWLSFALKLIQPNAIGKPDYLPTMEFLRASPAILGDIEEVPVRARVVGVGALLAEQQPEFGIAWLSESPRVMRALPTTDWRIKVLQYGRLLGEKDAQAALAFLRRGPEIVAIIGDGAQAVSRFENWFKAGMEVAAYNLEGARAYFAVESQRALSSVEEALSGVPLRLVARRVKLFVEGLCGLDVAIAALPDSATQAGGRATVSADGRTISLPAILRRYRTAEENERLYLIMAAHEAGHLEFGTYRLPLESLADLQETVCRRYGHSQCEKLDSLKDVFRLYPHPRLAQDLWTVLEDARVEYLLQASYPGLKRDLAQVAADAIVPRDPAQGLTVKELIVDCLLRLSSGEPESSAVPGAVRTEVAELWQLCQPLFSSTATAESAVRLTHDVYVRMEELLAPRTRMIPAEQWQEGSEELGVGPTASEETGEGYRPVTNWAYRGEVNPEFIRGEDRRSEEFQSQAGGLASGGGGSKEGAAGGGQGQAKGGQRSDVGEVFGGGRSLPPVVDELLALNVESPILESRGPSERGVRYPEWDYTIQDYRINWSRVIERTAEPGSDEAVSAALTTHRSAIRSLRRFFEGLRPPGFRRVPGQTEGDDLDLDALIRWASEQRAGLEGEDRLYVRREKKERSVAVAFLVDVSGSTGRRLDGGRRVIDVEKESLVLLCEALEAVGDQYALYAYSGQGRASVEFLTVKDFEERLGPTTAHRLGGLAPRQQNRDGAAIRHAVTKLKARDAKARLLVLVSDGRPLDGDYKDEYSLEDTKAALMEARRHGIDPFCVTIDRDADNYVRRMYGDVHYAVIDKVEALPLSLPRLYHRMTA